MNLDFYLDNINDKNIKYNINLIYLIFNYELKNNYDILKPLYKLEYIKLLFYYIINKNETIYIKTLCKMLYYMSYYVKNHNHNYTLKFLLQKVKYINNLNNNKNSIMYFFNGYNTNINEYNNLDDYHKENLKKDNNYLFSYIIDEYNKLQRKKYSSIIDIYEKYFIETELNDKFIEYLEIYNNLIERNKEENKIIVRYVEENILNKKLDCKYDLKYFLLYI